MSRYEFRREYKLKAPDGYIALENAQNLKVCGQLLGIRIPQNILHKLIKVLFVGS